MQEARQALQAEAVAGMSPYCSRLVGMLDDSHAPQPQVCYCGKGIVLQPTIILLYRGEYMPAVKCCQTCAPGPVAHLFLSSVTRCGKSMVIVRAGAQQVAAATLCPSLTTMAAHCDVPGELYPDICLILSLILPVRP